MYADSITGSLGRAIRETDRRRKIQVAYNKKYNITPRTIIKEIKDILPTGEIAAIELSVAPKTKRGIEELLKEKEKEMREAAEDLNFEFATLLREEIKELSKHLSENKKKVIKVGKEKKEKARKHFSDK